MPRIAALGSAERVLVAGAGGGFDGYAGLPLALTLGRLGKEVHLANLSFSALDLIDLDAYHGVCHAHVLENLAALDRDGAYLDAVEHARLHTATRTSIVNGQIAGVTPRERRAIPR